MTDKNGIEMKTGDTVIITGGYFKCDNGMWKIVHSPGDYNWTGKDHCLMKMNKNGTESKIKYNIAFWPLGATDNRSDINEVRQHNEKNAQIEVIDPPPVKKAKPETGIKFLYNGVKIDGILYKCRYSIGPYNEASKLPTGTVTLRAKSYSTDFPKIAGSVIQNNSDSQADYYEKDTMRIFPDSPYYKDAMAAYEKAEAKNKVQIQKKFGQVA